MCVSRQYCTPYVTLYYTGVYVYHCVCVCISLRFTCYACTRVSAGRHYIGLLGFFANAFAVSRVVSYRIYNVIHHIINSYNTIRPRRRRVFPRLVTAVVLSQYHLIALVGQDNTRRAFPWSSACDLDANLGDLITLILSPPFRLAGRDDVFVAMFHLITPITLYTRFYKKGKTMMCVLSQSHKKAIVYHPRGGRDFSSRKHCVFVCRVSKKISSIIIPYAVAC